MTITSVGGSSDVWQALLACFKCFYNAMHLCRDHRRCKTLMVQSYDCAVVEQVCSCAGHRQSLCASGVSRGGEWCSAVHGIGSEGPGPIPGRCHVGCILRAGCPGAPAPPFCSHQCHLSGNCGPVPVSAPCLRSSEGSLLSLPKEVLWSHFAGLGHFVRRKGMSYFSVVLLQFVH